MVKEKEIPETNLSKAVIDLLIEIPMFDQIKSDDLKILARSMNFMDFQPREVIFSEGDKGDFVCFVTRGALDVVKKNEKGKEVVIATLGKAALLVRCQLLMISRGQPQSGQNHTVPCLYSHEKSLKRCWNSTPRSV